MSEEQKPVVGDGAETVALFSQVKEGDEEEIILYASICNTPNESATPTLERLQTLFAFTLVDNDGRYCFQFSSVAHAKHWCAKMAHLFPDSAMMIGKYSDSLVQAFPLFRVNEGL